MASRKTAEAIVRLLSDDPGTAELRNTYRVRDGLNPVAQPVSCGNCGKQLKPGLYPRRFCSRKCYRSHVGRKTGK